MARADALDAAAGAAAFAFVPQHHQAMAQAVGASPPLAAGLDKAPVAAKDARASTAGRLCLPAASASETAAPPNCEIL